MAVKMALQYGGDLHCELEHEPSSTKIATDAPRDNMGLGSAFSPTDLVGAALLSCAITTMAIKAKRSNLDFGSASGSVIKEMTQEGPRQIRELQVRITMPRDLTSEQRQMFEDVARTCPVARSLADSVRVPMVFVYPD